MNAGFCGERKTGEKPLKQGRESGNNKLNSHMTPSPGMSKNPKFSIVSICISFVSLWLTVLNGQYIFKITGHVSNNPAF
jgi:hypothetical protein